MILISQRPLEIPLTYMLPMTILKQLVFNNVFTTRNSRKNYYIFLMMSSRPKTEKKNVFKYIFKMLFTISNAILTLQWENQICQVRATHH